VGVSLPPTGAWQRGELPDTNKIKNAIAADYRTAFPNSKPPKESVSQLEALYPFLTALNKFAAQRPFCRFNLDYSAPPIDRPFALLVQQMKLSKILTLHAILELDAHRSDLALADIETNYKISSGVKRDPSLIGGLISLALTRITGAAIYDGLSSHFWNDSQLAAIEQLLAPLNTLADCQFALRSEALEDVIDFEYLKKTGRYPDLDGYRILSGKDFLFSQNLRQPGLEVGGIFTRCNWLRFTLKRSLPLPLLYTGLSLKWTRGFRRKPRKRVAGGMPMPHGI
jgi:hypothetical protein